MCEHSWVLLVTLTVVVSGRLEADVSGRLRGDVGIFGGP